MEEKVQPFKRSRILIACFPVALFIAVISINYNKPFGFFRESNPAMVCINAIMWQQHPEMARLGVPISSYAFDSTALPDTQLYNTIVSFGSGWFALPYYFFKVFSLPPNEHSIRLFSLLWLTITLATAYLLCRQIVIAEKHKSIIIWFTLVFYLLNAATLWYHVQGYLHEIAALPFYFTGWWLFSKYLQSPSLKILLAIVLVLFAGIQFDWLPFFQAMVMSAYLLFSKQKTNKWAFLLPGLAVAAGIILIFYRYVQWAGLLAYISHLQEKFLKRTIGSGKLELIHGLNHNFNIFVFYATGYGLLGLTFVICLYKRLITHPIIWMMIGAASLHHIVFWGFSSEHDHGVIKMAFPLAFAAALLLKIMKTSKQIIGAAAIVSVNIALYFFLHNIYSRPGMYANPQFCYNVGTYVHKYVNDSKAIVFLNTEGKYFQQIEFYAKRSYVLADSYGEASAILRLNFPGMNGYYVEVVDGKVSGSFRGICCCSEYVF